MARPVRHLTTKMTSFDRATQDTEYKYKQTPENNPNADRGGAILGCVEWALPALLVWMFIVAVVLLVAK